MKRVLVTGARGFIGQHTLPFLESKGFEVSVSSGVDVLDQKAMQALLQAVKPTHLLHLAWYAKPPQYWHSPVNFSWVKASLDLLEAFIGQGGKRAVFAGTCAEYDWQYGLCKEYETPCQPNTVYGTAKYALSLLAEAMAKQHNLSFASGRIFFLFGPHEYRERLISGLICHVLTQQKFTLNSAYQIRDFMYVKDVASALVALLDSEVSGSVNIGSGEVMRVGDLAHLLAQKLKAEPWINEERPAQKTNMIVVPELTRLFNEVNWRPAYTLDQALDETILWWKEHVSHG